MKAFLTKNFLNTLLPKITEYFQRKIILNDKIIFSVTQCFKLFLGILYCNFLQLFSFLRATFYCNFYLVLRKLLVRFKKQAIKLYQYSSIVFHLHYKELCDGLFASLMLSRTQQLVYKFVHSGAKF